MTLKLQPRRLAPCHRHPNEPLTSLCAPCLRERLSVLNPSLSSAATKNTSLSSSTAACPELRRCKTFSAETCESLGLSHEPRRRSCEVRARSSLEDLLIAADNPAAKCKVESKNVGLLGGTYPVPELREDEYEYEESDSEVRVSADVIASNALSLRVSDLDLEETIEDEDSKTIKEFIDLELQSNKPVRRDFKEIAGSFWIAASVFSKKVQRWKRKQKNERIKGECDRRRHGSNGDGGLGEMRLENLRGRRLRDVQPEPGDYGFGRRSCDTDPRFSIDIGRASIDGGRISVDGIGKRFFDTDPRFSLDLGRASVDCGRMLVEETPQGCFDAPRASWDGYMSGRMVPRSTTPVVSVIENAMATVYGFDNRTMLAGRSSVEKDDRKSFGGIVARHLDSVSLHIGRKAVDQSSSKTNEEDGECQLVSCTEKPPGEVEIFYGTKLLITEKELMDSRMTSSLKDDNSDSFDTASKDMTSSTSSSSTGVGSRKSMKWGKLLNVWSLLNRSKQSKSFHHEEETSSDPSKKVLREGNEEEVSSNPNWKLTRSHSVASSRGSYTIGSSALEPEGKSLNLKRREVGVLERNRSAKYSPSHVQNGMLRFYLTPLRSGRRSKSGKNRLNTFHSSGSSVIKL